MLSTVTRWKGPLSHEAEWDKSIHLSPSDSYSLFYWKRVWAGIVSFWNFLSLSRCINDLNLNGIHFLTLFHNWLLAFSEHSNPPAPLFFHSFSTLSLLRAILLIFSSQFYRYFLFTYFYLTPLHKIEIIN